MACRAMRLWFGVCASLLGASVAWAAPKVTLEHRVEHGSASVQGAVLTAGPEGAVVALSDGLKVQLSAGTVLRRFGTQEVWFESLGKTRSQLFQVDKGHLVATLEAGDAKPVPAVFHTQHNLTGVCLGGTLGLDIASNASVANLSGAAEVRKGSKWRALKAGEVLINGKHNAAPESRTLLSAPAWSQGRRLWSGLAGVARVGGFQWRAVAGSSAYRVNIRDASEQDVYRTTATGSQLPSQVAALPAGHYSAVVQALDEWGFPGEKSAAFDFQVLGFAVSDGSYLDSDGVVRVASDGLVKMVAAEGLEMTFGDLDRWGPVPPQLMLRRTERTLVSFRYPGERDVVMLPVQAQAVVADVAFGPQLATWPGEAVNIEVHLRDAADGVAALRTTPVISTSIGLEPIDLQWTRQGNTLTARVPAQTGTGPWVIRVSVALPSGEELGRDLLEVASKFASPRPRPRFPDAIAPRRVASAQ